MEWEHEDIITDPQEQCREDTEVLVEAVQQGVQPWAHGQPYEPPCHSPQA